MNQVELNRIDSRLSLRMHYHLLQYWLISYFRCVSGCPKAEMYRVFRKLRFLAVSLNIYAKNTPRFVPCGIGAMSVISLHTIKAASKEEVIFERYFKSWRSFVKV